MSRAIRTTIAGLVVLVLLAGCALLPATGRIAYARSGGFAGYDDRLEIAADGSAVLTDRGHAVRFEVDPTTLRALDAALAGVDVQALPVATLPPGAADMFWYTFEWRGQRYGATEVPPALQPATAILSGIVEAHRPPR